MWALYTSGRAGYGYGGRQVPGVRRDAGRGGRQVPVSRGGRAWWQGPGVTQGGELVADMPWTESVRWCDLWGFHCHVGSMLLLEGTLA